LRGRHTAYIAAFASVLIVASFAVLMLDAGGESAGGEMP